MEIVDATPAAAMPEPAQDRRAQLLEARAERERLAAAEQEAHELLCLELEDRFCREYGKRGQGWDMANEDNSCGEGPICIRLGDPVSHKQWQASGSAPEDKQTYVAPYIVYPEKTLALEILHRRPELLGRAVMVMTRLYGFSQGILQGKF
jgi:hypothetical protein